MPNLLEGMPEFADITQDEQPKERIRPPQVVTDAVMPVPVPQQQMRNIGDIAATRRAIYDNVANAVRNMAPVHNNRFELSFADVDYEGPETYGTRETKQAVLNRKTLGRRLRANMLLKDVITGDVVDQKRMTLGTVPTLLDSGSYVLSGNKYGLLHQARLRPGVFAKHTDSGEIISHVNVAGGLGHKYELEPDSGIFRVIMGNSRIPALPLLRTLGVSDDDIRASWGDEVFEANDKVRSADAIHKIYNKLRGGRVKPGEDKEQAIRDAFARMELDPEVTSRTLGKPYDMMTPDAALDSMTKLLAIQRGDAEDDDRDAMPYQRLFGPEDLFADRIKRATPLLNQMLWKATYAQNLKRTPSKPLDKLFSGTLLDTGLGAVLQEINPAEMLDYSYRVSRMGEGGIVDASAIPESARDLMPSYSGFIDPGLSPESGRIGVDNRLAINTKKDEQGRLYASYINARTGQQEWHSPQDVEDKVVAFPGELESGEDYMAATQKGKHVYVPRDEVDYTLEHATDMYSPLSNLIPLKAEGEAKRVSMGGRMIAQALPLVSPEAPWVQSGMPGGERSFEAEYGEALGARRAPAGGVVTSVEPGIVTIKSDDGTVSNVELYDNHPSNMKTFQHNTPVVRVGQYVEEGDIVARSNYTDDEGTAALGLNARVAYLPWLGSIAHDTHVLWYNDGQPQFTEVKDVLVNKRLSTLATDPEQLTTRVMEAAGFSSHRANTLLEITTSSGRILDATTNHSFVTLSDSGELQECCGAQLREKESWLPRLGRVDLPVTCDSITIGQSVRRDIRRPPICVPLTEEFGFLCGMFAAEGYVAANKCTSYAATDPVTRKALVTAITKVFPHVNIKERDWDIAFHCARVAQWFKKNFGEKAQRKRVAGFVFGAPLTFRRAFVAGFWTGDARVHDKKGIPTDTDTIITSRVLRDGLGLLLASLGISTTHGRYTDDKYTEPWVYRLGVSSRDAHKLPSICQYHTDKGIRLNAVIASYKDTGAGDHIPLFADARKEYSACGRGKGRRVYSRIGQQVREGHTASRRDVLTYVPEDATGPLSRLRRLAASTLEWDRVEKIREVPCSNWVYDFDMEPLRTFVCVDTLVVHNSNFEDGIVVSESFAKRATSEQMYSDGIDLGQGINVGKNEFVSSFPSKYDKDTLAKFDTSGLIKPGEKVEYGDPIILATKERQQTARLGRRKRTFADAAVTWEHHDPGLVTDVVKGNKDARVFIKTQSPLKQGDKLCYDPETDVLTQVGWKKISDVTATDLIASLNPCTHQIEYVRPVEIQEYTHHGRMYSLETTQVSLLVTDNHALYAKKRYAKDYALIEAQELVHQQYSVLRGGLHDTVFSDALVNDDALQDCWVNYTGSVHCVTLEKNHVMYVRRKGKPVWCGNSGRWGDKGIVARIVPDAQLPHDSQGRPIEVLLNSESVISRGNPAQNLEAALGKIAAITGKPYKPIDFDTRQDMVDYVEHELDKHGMEYLETLHDPLENRDIPNIGVGNRFMMKLHHLAEGKLAGRSAGDAAYTSEGEPASGGVTGSKRVGMLELAALMSHGAYDTVRDASLIRGQSSPEYWRRVMAGYDAPPPEVPFTYKKFVASLKAAGINPVREGTRTHFMALRNQDIDQLAEDREIQRADTVNWNDPSLKPVKGGLFDPLLTGGMDGDRWSKITLPRPLPSPVMEEPIRRVLGLTENKFRDVISGKESLSTGTGPEAIYNALDGIDLDHEIDHDRALMHGSTKTHRDAAIRRLRYLEAAKRQGIHPREWTLDKVPVLPPKFRPISIMGTSGTRLIADANVLYKELMDARDVREDLGKISDDVGDSELDLYDALKGVIGMGDPIQPVNREKRVKGILKTVLGDNPKQGVVHRKLLGSQVDLVGRATISPNPDLDMDQIGLPEESAWSLYEPFVVRRLVRRGMPRLQATKDVKERSERARSELMTEMGERPLIINRAPTLHKLSVLAMWPRLTKSSTLEIPPVITGPLNADFDGDAMQFHVPASEGAVRDAVEKMMPSKNLFSASDFKSPVFAPTMEYIAGLWEASTRRAKTPPKVFRSLKDAKAARARGEINVDTPITILEE